MDKSDIEEKQEIKQEVKPEIKPEVKPEDKSKTSPFDGVDISPFIPLLMSTIYGSSPSSSPSSSSPSSTSKSRSRSRSRSQNRSRSRSQNIREKVEPEKKSNPIDFNAIINFASSFMNLLSSPKSNQSNQSEQYKHSDMMSSVVNLYDGLDKFSDDKIRSIIFMNNLNNLSKKVFGDLENSYSKDEVTKTGFKNIKENFEYEIFNVISQIQGRNN